MYRAILLASLLCASLALGLLAQTQENPALEEFKARQRALIARQRTYLGSGVQLGPSSEVGLLRSPAVQEELHLTSSQKARIKELLDTRTRSIDQQNELLQSSKARDNSGGINADPEKVAEKIAKAEASFFSVMSVTGPALLKTLERGQRGRLDEIRLQAEGPFAFTRPEIVERLNIDPERAEAIKAIIADGREEQIRVSALPTAMERAYFSRSDPAHLTQPSTKAFQSELEKARQAALKVRGKTMQMIGRLLTKNQRAKYQKILGEPFDLAKLRTAPAATQPSDSKEKIKDP
jgi:hypothetical protein